MAAHDPDLVKLNQTLEKICRVLAGLTDAVKHASNNLESLKSAWQNPDEWRMIEIPNCTCPWNNQMGPPGILPPHKATCPTVGPRWAPFP